MLNALERLQTFNEHSEPLLAPSKNASKRNIGPAAMHGHGNSHHHLHRGSVYSMESEASDTASLAYVTLQTCVQSPHHLRRMDEAKPVSLLWWLGIVLAIILPEVLAKLVRVVVCPLQQHPGCAGQRRCDAGRHADAAGRGAAASCQPPHPGSIIGTHACLPITIKKLGRLVQQ